ncbi:hypothetical protein [Dyadobacter aurulentus]|uniref:hypothetical protein n=1 Tax=Dyadobacter sp. UC 10 TaxID=2605428 RepID=UPI0011F2071A|nr:hypothetical protein [Dyadobacter sp. UC 10]KAA0991628.1 hypothetical protein FXO21_16345 [Dyadobacter sp. UC 10]
METNIDPPADQKPKSTVTNTVEYFKEMLAAGAPGAAGQGLGIGVGAVLARTALKRLPAPLNFVVPMVVEKVILKHGVEEGRELLLKGLRWVKKATDETPEAAS